MFFSYTSTCWTKVNENAAIGVSNHHAPNIKRIRSLRKLSYSKNGGRQEQKSDEKAAGAKKANGTSALVFAMATSEGFDKATALFLAAFPEEERCEDYAEKSESSGSGSCNNGGTVEAVAAMITSICG